MSSTTSSTTTSGSPAVSSAPAQSATPIPQTPTANSQLYLFTFLATLLLLLAVSCAIVARSFILRRRFRRRIEEALAAGVILPQQGDRRRFFGEKPQMWEAWVAPGLNEKWQDIMPVAAKVLAPPGLEKEKTGTGGGTSGGEYTSMNNLIGRALRNNLFNRLRDQPAAPPVISRSTSSSPSTPTTSARPADEVVPSERLQVSVFIAMPTPGRPYAASTTSLKGKERNVHDDLEDDELPALVMGVAEVPWKVGSDTPR